MTRAPVQPQSDEPGERDEGVDPAARREIEPAEPERVLLHMPVDVRSLSLVVIAVLASVFALQWAKAVVVPILFGVMFSYALAPAVDRLQRWRLPRAAGATLVLATIVTLIGSKPASRISTATKIAAR